MKLIVAIIHKDDVEAVARELSRFGHSSTTLDSRGGFLHKENKTLISVVHEMHVTDAIRIIGETAQKHEAEVPGSETDGFYNLPSRVTVGGAVVFVLDVEQMYKL